MSIPPEKWLQTKVSEFEENQDKSLILPKKHDGSNFEIVDLYDDQQYLQLVVLEKLHEFMNCEDLSKFTPLRLTLVGAGGTGKSVLLLTIRSCIRRMFNSNKVCKTAAPTGVAAFNAGGETLQHMTCRGIESNYEPGSMKTEQRKKLLARFETLLCLIIDERSMMSSSLLGCTAQIVSETIFEGTMADVLDLWGALPILIIAGDDYQLASMYQGAIQCLTRIDGNKMTEKGRQCFRECARTVFELLQSRRLADDNTDDREILSALRIGERIAEEQVDKLLSLHLDSIKNVHGADVVTEIEDKSIYLFWTNEKRIQHNIDHLVKMNGPENPTCIIKPKSVGMNKHGKAVNGHFQGDYPGFCLICDGCKVAVQGCNFNPIWGLHNGACGIVRERVFSKGTNPNDNGFPLHIVVEFPLYIGPAWDQDNPKVIFVVDC